MSGKAALSDYEVEISTLQSWSIASGNVCRRKTLRFSGLRLAVAFFGMHALDRHQPTKRFVPSLRLSSAIVYFFVKPLIYSGCATL